MLSGVKFVIVADGNSVAAKSFCTSVFDHAYAKHQRLENCDAGGSTSSEIEPCVTQASSSSTEWLCEKCHALELENRQLKRKVAIIISVF